ncbi:MAG: threonine/serine dehydratase [Acidobacteria bacterium]|nr:MAG: threonine/serine dehydratase [Acidobacteriota bacterium]REK04078.1 MAG: threonine/serine dehydratase [Acidobacteriota bacterium]REK15240.1 MAG: threonine/serine dehydratase [Acidobacteriota bacterium]REK46330.1 MAG: threonine/serine dehydratase [Acidobacteriota bacterium]
MPFLEEIKDAYSRIERHLRRTYLQHSLHYSSKTGADVYFKCEHLQHTGSFKLRGALNKILSLSEEELARGVVTASTGNHGAAVAYALAIAGASGSVYVPKEASESKIANIRRLGAEIEMFGDDSNDSEMKARQVAGESGAVYVSPYNDPFVVAGQGTVGLEISEQLPDVDAVFVSVGGGGLISGIAGYLKAFKPDVMMVGCSPANSKVMLESVKAGKVLELESLPTLSDGTAGGVDPDSITFGLCSDLVDEWVTVSEAEIRESLIEFIDAEHQLIEGSAAVAIASMLKTAESFRGKNIAVVLCGGNIGTTAMRSVLGDPL